MWWKCELIPDVCQTNSKHWSINSQNQSTEASLFCTLHEFTCHVPTQSKIHVTFISYLPNLW